LSTISINYLVRFVIQWNLTLGVQNSYPIYRTTQITFKRDTYLQILRQGISPETELASEPNPEFAELASSGTEPDVSKAAKGGG
jgi:hypothetical protein